jgi:hypothetical protein
MALTPEQLDEIRLYMDSRAEIWRHASRSEALTTLEEARERQRRQIGWWLGALGVTGVAAIGAIFTFLSQIAEETAARSGRDAAEEIVEDIENLSAFLEQALQSTIQANEEAAAARTVARLVEAQAEAALDEILQLLEDAQSTRADLTDALEAAEASDVRVQVALDAVRNSETELQNALATVQTTVEETGIILRLSQEQSDAISAQSEEIQASLVATLRQAAELRAGLLEQSDVLDLAARVSEALQEGTDTLVQTLAQDPAIRDSIFAEVTFPSDTILVSLAPCDTLSGNWVDFTDGQGRMLLGANPLGANDLPLSNAGDTGGAPTVTLGVSHIPAHQHTATGYVELSSDPGIGSGPTPYVLPNSNNLPAETPRFLTDSWGGARRRFHGAP